MNILPHLSNFLKYGLTGLGAIVAVLAFFLLKNEQNRSPKRVSTINGIYAFMVFGIAIIIIGLFAPREGSANSNRNKQTHDIQAQRAKKPSINLNQKGAKGADQDSKINLSDSEDADIKVVQDASGDTIKDE